MEFSVASYLERRKATKKLLGFSKMSKNHTNCITEDSETACETKPRRRRATLANLTQHINTLRPTTVDVYSRAIFPIAFFLFQLGYWLVTLNLESAPEDMIILDRK